MTKVEMARDIYESIKSVATRAIIIKNIMDKTDSGEAYASTLYNKVRKLGIVSDKIVSTKSVDESKSAFVSNCWRVQGLKAGHYLMTVEVHHKMITVSGVNNNGLVMVKEGTKVRVQVDTTDVMKVLRKVKFVGKK